MEGNLSLILVSLSVVAIISISVILLRMCIYNCLARKKTPISTQWAQSVTRRNNQVSAATTELTPSDHQIVFEGATPPLRNIPRLNAATSATQIVQQLDEQLHLDHLEMEHQRRARERREALERNMPLQIADCVPDYISVISNERRIENYPNAPTREELEIVANNYNSSLNPAPLYISQDDELPSYEEAVTKNNGSSV